MNTITVDYSKDFVQPITDKFKEIIIRDIRRELDCFKKPLNSHNGTLEVIIANNRDIEIKTLHVPNFLKEEIEQTISNLL